MYIKDKWFIRVTLETVRGRLERSEDATGLMKEPPSIYGDEHEQVGNGLAVRQRFHTQSVR